MFVADNVSNPFAPKAAVPKVVPFRIAYRIAVPAKAPNTAAPLPLNFG